MKTMMRCLVVVLTLITVTNAQWVRAGLDSLNVYKLAVSGKNLFAIDNAQYSGLGRGVFISTNNGDSWKAVNNGLPEYSAGIYSVNTIIVDETNIFAGTTGHGVYLSTDNGANWKAVNSAIQNIGVRSLAVSGNIIIAGCDSGIYRSTNKGTDWALVNTGLPGSYIIESLAANGNYILATANKPSYGARAVLLSTDYGINWDIVDSARGYTSFVVCPNGIGGNNFYYGYSLTSWMFGSWGGVRFSTNNGATWGSLLRNENGPGVRALSFIPTVTSNIYLLAGLEYPMDPHDLSQQKASDNKYSLVLSTNHGSKWIPVDSGITGSPNVLALGVLGTNLFAGTNNGVWRRPLSEMITSVTQSSVQLPENYSLSQNFPNPFNPSTTIRYALPSSANVKLAVYDLLGREIATLVNEEQSAGWKEVEWNASAFSSGIYFYKLEANEKREIKKMILMK